ncbi:MAG: hypothetical protein HY332_09515 [Chloroflexi bacterium]|nr:hypothetical protein [Chloroflexota bacterium]
MNRNQWLAALAVTAAMLAPDAALARPDRQIAPLPHGAVVALSGTPHLWIAGDDGLLHWAGDTRAVAGKFVDWGNRREVTLDELKTLSRGDPWLSTGLLKSGDPIYLAKWETEAAAPTLLHIQSLADVELFGINATNYGSMVFEPPAWEALSGMSSGALMRGVLSPVSAASSAAIPAATATPASTTAASAETPTPVVRLNRTPRTGRDGDVTFEMSAADRWRNDADLSAPDARLQPMHAETIIGRWQIFDSPSETGPRVFVFAFATNLDFNPDIRSLDDFVRRKQDALCLDIGQNEGDFCTVEPAVATTVGGLPAQQRDSRERHTYFLGDPANQNIVENEWLSRHVFVIRGNWGYELRIFSQDPTALRDRLKDFAKALESVRFNY